MGDVCDQTSAKELAGILRAEPRFAPLIDLLEEGKPLSVRQIASRLRLSRGAAAQLFQEARELLAAKGGLELPALQVPPLSRPKRPPKKARPRVHKATPIARNLPAVPSADSSNWQTLARDTLAAVQAALTLIPAWKLRISRCMNALRAS